MARIEFTHYGVIPRYLTPVNGRALRCARCGVAGDQPGQLLCQWCWLQDLKAWRWMFGEYVDEPKARQLVATREWTEKSEEGHARLTRHDNNRGSITINGGLELFGTWVGEGDGAILELDNGWCYNECGEVVSK